MIHLKMSVNYGKWQKIVCKSTEFCYECEDQDNR